MAGSEIHSPYSARQYIWAVNLSACLGWFAVAALPLLIEGFHSGRWNHMLGLITWLALFGLPVALIIAWVCFAPFIRELMRKKVSYGRASIWGASVGAVLTALSIAIGRLLGWRKSLDPSSFSQIGGGDRIRAIDGILTPYGWWVLFQTSISFIIACVVIGIVIRALLGPGENEAISELNK